MSVHPSSKDYGDELGAKWKEGLSCTRRSIVKKFVTCVEVTRNNGDPMGDLDNVILLKTPIIITIKG